MRYSRSIESQPGGMHLIFLTLWRSLLLLGLALRAPFERGRTLKGGLLVLLALPFFLFWQLLHWIGLAIDEVLFRGYRRIEIVEPLFIVGPPRTGTTHLHHVLSSDSRYTSFRTWECLFGLSVSARYLILGCARLHRAVGSPLAWLGRKLSKRLFASMEDIHPIRLDDPEEDFLALMPIMACFLLLVPLPSARWLLSIARCDTELSRSDQQRLMKYYRRAIQKHLYVFGREDKRFLSKNASFPGAVSALLREFPDARLIATVRDPMSVVPSQLSSLRPALELCGYDTVPTKLKDDLLALLPFYYMNLKTTAAGFPGRLAFIDNTLLRHDLSGSVTRAFAELGLSPSPELLEAIEARMADRGSGRGAKASKHGYSLDEFGLSETAIQSRFAAVYTAYTFADRSSQAQKG